MNLLSRCRFLSKNKVFLVRVCQGISIICCCCGGGGCGCCCCCCYEFVLVTGGITRGVVDQVLNVACHLASLRAGCSFLHYQGAG